MAAVSLERSSSLLNLGGLQYGLIVVLDCAKVLLANQGPNNLRVLEQSAVFLDGLELFHGFVF